MARKLTIEWQEEAAELEAAYKAERDRQIRPRLHALWRLRCGDPVQRVGELLGVHERTVHEWVRWYRVGGLAEVRRRRHGGHSPVRPWLTPEQEAALRAKADAGDFRCLQAAVTWVAETYQITYSYWGMRSLFGRMKLKLKVPRPSNPKASAAAQEAWKKGGSRTPYGARG